MLGTRKELRLHRWKTHRIIAIWLIGGGLKFPSQLSTFANCVYLIGKYFIIKPKKTESIYNRSLAQTIYFHGSEKIQFNIFFSVLIVLSQVLLYIRKYIFFKRGKGGGTFESFTIMFLKNQNKHTNFEEAEGDKFSF